MLPQPNRRGQGTELNQPRYDDNECVAFLQWALPRTGRRWEGYRKVRRRVCRRINRRVAELGLGSLAEYRAHLEGGDPREWSVLDSLSDVVISRFYRDRAVFDFLRDDVLPELAERPPLRVWSAGCANGEEPYTLAILGERTGTAMEILATDIDPTVLQRAERARYPRSAVRDVPASWREFAFSHLGDELELLPPFREPVRFAQHDIRTPAPAGPFDLVLCRYQAFTYFDEAGQRAAVRSFAGVMRAGAVLVLGSREQVPDDERNFEVWSRKLCVFRRTRTRTSDQPLTPM